MQSNQGSPAAEQGNGGQHKPDEKIPPPTAIWRKVQIAQPPQTNGAKQRPKQEQAGEKKRTMEKRFEIKVSEENQEAMRGKILGAPKEKRSKQRGEQNRPGEIGKQSGCVLQGC